ncbi:MAG: SurA N-terminal domain-containing protein [Wenzhouxiangellaceae bacterium]|nr:SurA N-terminal domain-containing protein [Wenzhouxiangellaceae bacterium]
MLQAIRDRMTGVVAFVILGFIAIPFVFFGLESYTTTVPRDAVARVGDLEISQVDFQREFAQYRARLRDEQGDAYNELAVNRPETRREFLDSMIDRRLLIHHAQQMGMAVSPATLAEVIRNIPAFQVNGQFNADIYRQRLLANGETVASFERQVASDILVQMLPNGVTGSSIVTSADIDRWLTAQMETRDIAWLAVDSRPWRDEVVIGDDDIEAFYRDNTARFMRPERIALEYIELQTEPMVADQAIPEDQLRERYEAVKSRFMTPERRRAAHILFAIGPDQDAEQAREQAEQAAARLAAGESFAALAEELSDDPVSAANGGDLGWIEPDVMMPEFEQALYELDETAVSAPVQTDFGWHLIQLTELEAPRGQSFEEARDEIAAEVREERADDLYVELSDRLVDMVYADPTGLAAIAEDLGLELQSAGPFSRFGAPGVLADPQVLEAAFSELVLVERQASELIEVGRNHAVVVHVTEHQPSEPRPLDDVREEIVNQLTAERARDRAREIAEAWLAELRAGDVDLEALAEREQLEVQTAAATRRSFELGGQVLEALFRLPVPADGESNWDVLGRGDQWLLVRLDQVRPGDPAAADAAQRQSARQQIRFARAQGEFEGLLEWLRANTEIEVAAERL